MRHWAPCERCPTRAPPGSGSGSTTAAAPSAAPAAARQARLAANLPAARRVVAAINATRREGEPSAQAGELAALELLHEIFHLLVARAAELQPDAAMEATAAAVDDDLGDDRLDELLDAVAGEFPDVGPEPDPARLEELLLIRLANENPAARPLWVLVDDAPVPAEDRGAAMASLEAYQAALAPDRAQRRDAGRAAAGARPAPTRRRSPGSCATSASSGAACSATRSTRCWTGSCSRWT